MDDRAYHLQAKAHSVVARAMHEGRLNREPCEVCGAAGQAHHDSYYPDKWLDVRWLCASHHKQWHGQNEPIWPTIYEFHPSDAKQSFADDSLANPRVGRAVGKRGPIPRPWFRKRTRSWHVWIGKRQVGLGRDYAEAIRKCELLLNEGEPPVTR